MRLLSSLLWVFALPVFPIGGCTEVTTPNTVQLVRTIVDEFSGELIEGAVMCQAEADNCGTTDANGRVTLEVPANEKLSRTLEKDGYASTLIGGVFPGLLGEVGTTTMFPDTYLVEQSNRVETGYPPTDTGIIFVFLFVTFPGATFDLLDATGKRYYSDEEWDWSLDLTETVSRPPTPIAINHGDGGFVEVPSGDVQIEMGGTAERCTPFSGWPGDQINRVRQPVKEGFVTYAVIVCPPP